MTAFIIFKVMANMMTDEFEKEIGMKGYELCRKRLNDSGWYYNSKMFSI